MMSTSTGRSRNHRVGATPYVMSTTVSPPIVTAASTDDASAAANGSTSRGKYTFLMTDALSTRLGAAAASAVVKRAHGASPTEAKSG